MSNDDSRWLQSRRRFLRGSLALALATTARGAGAVLSPMLSDLHARHTRTGFAFGTRVSVTVAGLETAKAKAALDAAMAEIAAVERAVDLHADSPLARLNHAGRLAAPPAHLLALMRAARAWGQASHGAFDVTVQPLWQCYFAAAARNADPGDDDIERARAFIGWNAIRIDDAGLAYEGANMQATLNGMAQGYASDRAWDVLQAHGAPLALVDAGEWRAGGATAATPWRLGVRDPRAPHALKPALIDLVELHDGALASSGADGLWFTPAHHAHHILDPRSGRSPAELAGVTVLASDACTADVLSTACMVLGIEQGLDLVGRTPDAQALFVRNDGVIAASDDWPGLKYAHIPG